MKYLLSDICEVQQGRNVNSSKLIENGRYIYFNLKDLKENSFKSFTRTNVDIHSRYLVERDDILFSIRGQFQAYRIPNIMDVPVIASSMFAILKPNIKMVSPSYLLWYLNHPSTQKIIQLATPANSRMPFISLKILKYLEIEVPELKRQKAIIEIDNLHQKEVMLYMQICELKTQLIQTTLLNSITK